MTRSVPRNDEPDPDNIPQPTQARADAIKERASGIAPTEAPTVIDTPAVAVNGVISSAAQVGDTLACTMGNWTGEPDAYAYQWKNGQTDLGTGASYIVVAGDAPGSITCVVTALNAAGATTAPPSNAVMVQAAAAQQQQEEVDHGTEHRTHQARRDR